MAGEAISPRIIKLLLILRVSQFCLDKLVFEQALAESPRSWTVEGSLLE